MNYKDHKAVLSLIEAVSNNPLFNYATKNDLITLLTEHIELVELVKGNGDFSSPVKRPTIDQIRMGAREGWPVFELARGYSVFEDEGTGMFMLSAVYDMEVFANDEEAAHVAEADGFPIIPVSELPANFKYREFCWIDTPANRKLIAKVANFERVSDDEKAEATQQADDYIEKYCRLD